MKCFIVSYNGLSNSGGVERVCFYIDRIMKDKGYDTVIVDKILIENFWIGKIFKFIFGNIPILLVSVLSSLYIIQNKKRTDICITNGFNCPFVKSDILYIHGTMAGFGDAISTKHTWRSKLPLKFEQAAVKRAKNVICVSQNALNEIKYYYYKAVKSSMVINNMVDENIFYPINNSKDNRDSLVVLFCGRLDINKGVYKLLELCEYVKEHSLNIVLEIATNNSNNSHLFQPFEFVNVRVGLDVNQLNAFYNMGDVMYFPSMYEGFEMVTLEALSAGIPVLGNRVGAVAELHGRKEPGVELISSNDPRLILKQLTELSNNFSGPKSKEELHHYYSTHYGISAYLTKLNNGLKDFL